MIYVYFFIKCIVRWSENGRFEKSYVNWLLGGPNSVRFDLTVQDIMTCMDHMYRKSLKAIFSLKSKILDYESVSNNLNFKLFDALILPVLTYGAEIWVSDYNIKDRVLLRL